MEINLSSYREKYNTDAGHAFEYWCRDRLETLGYSNVEVTQGSGDFGIDIIAFKGSKKYGIQCKYYNSNVGNKAVMEAYSGSKYYDCDYAMLITNSKVTDAAKEYADKVGVIIYSDENISKLVELNKDSNTVTNDTIPVLDWVWESLKLFYNSCIKEINKKTASKPLDVRLDVLAKNYNLSNYIGRRVKLSCYIFYSNKNYILESYICGISDTDKFLRSTKINDKVLRRVNIQGTLIFDRGLLYIQNNKGCFELCSSPLGDLHSQSNKSSKLISEAFRSLL